MIEEEFDFVISHMKECNENLDIGFIYALNIKNLELFNYLLNMDEIKYNDHLNNYNIFMMTNKEKYKNFHSLMINKFNKDGSIVDFVKYCKINQINYKDYI